MPGAKKVGAALLVLAMIGRIAAINNGLGLTPPLGWRSYNAFGGRPTQAVMEATMEAMVDRSRLVAGQPMSLRDLGYVHVGLDGGWNQCFSENHTFHWASDGAPVWNDAFPAPKKMVAKAHALSLSPGWSVRVGVGDRLLPSALQPAADRYPSHSVSKVIYLLAIGTLTIVAAQKIISTNRWQIE